MHIIPTRQNESEARGETKRNHLGVERKCLLKTSRHKPHSPMADSLTFCPRLSLSPPQPNPTNLSSSQLSFRSALIALFSLVVSPCRHYMQQRQKQKLQHKTMMFFPSPHHLHIHSQSQRADLLAWGPATVVGPVSTPPLSFTYVRSRVHT